MARDFRKALQQDGELVTIQYKLRKPGIVADQWSESDGIQWQYNEVLCLKEIVSQLTFADSNVANVQFGKTNFYFAYEGYDFHGSVKRYIKIIDSNGQKYEIDKIVPMVKINQGYMAWMAIQK